MITINVDMDKCQHYGQCVFEARSDIESAVDVCPMQAISIVE